MHAPQRAERHFHFITGLDRGSQRDHFVRAGSGKGRLTQTGYVRNYALGLAFGAVVIAMLLISKAVY